MTKGTKSVELFKQALDQTDSDQPIVDGVQVVVSGPAPATIIAIEEYASWPVRI